MKTSVKILMALLIAGGTAPAQKMVRLANGAPVEARTKSLGRRLLLKTAFGQQTVRKKEVAGTTSAKDVRAEYRKLSGAIPKGKLAENKAVAQWCQKQGWLSGLREQLNTILAADMEDAWAGEVIADLARRFSVHPGEQGSRPRDKRDLYAHLLEKESARDRVGAVLARIKMSQVPRRLVLRPAIKAMKARARGTRWLAAQLLRPFRNEPDRIVPLYRRSLCDDAYMVRHEAVKSLAITQDPVFVKLYTKNLYNLSPHVRRNAAEALGGFKMKTAVPALIAALQDSGRPTRNHIIRTRHQAYVKDFDVEIAQAAVIADPIVDVATDGVVLDVGVVGVAGERRAIVDALASITGANFGKNAAAWSDWWKKQRQ